MASVASNLGIDSHQLALAHPFERPCKLCSRHLLNRIHSALHYATLSPSLSPSLCIYSCAHQRWRRSAPATAVA